MATVLRSFDNGTVNYTPAVAVAADTVVIQGTLVGIAFNAIAAGKLGALQVHCVAEFTKASGSGTAISAGAKVYINAVTLVVSTTNTDVYLGKVETAAAIGAVVVDVLMCP